MTCVQFAEQVVDRQNKSKEYNHWVHTNDKLLLENAAKADKRYKDGTNRTLEGIPIGLKDNISTTCSPTTGASPSLKGNVSKAESQLWWRLS